MVLTRRSCTRATLAAAALAATIAAGCAGVTPGDAFDRPMSTVYALFNANATLAPPTNPIIGVIWTDPLHRQHDVVMPAAWMHSDLEPAPGSPNFTLLLFRPPPPAALVDIQAPSPPGDHARLALGEIVVVDDADGDGQFVIKDPKDPSDDIGPRDSYLGGTSFALLYVDQPFASSQATFPLLPTLSRGYQLVSFQCDGQLSQGPVLAQGVALVLQPSRTLPEIRDCDRTHSP